MRTKERMSNFVEMRRQHYWRENSLATSDEVINSKFDLGQVKRFAPYVGRYRWFAFASISLMLLYTVLNLANPFLIGVAIDDFTRKGDLGGLGGVSIAVLIINVVTAQASYSQMC